MVQREDTPRGRKYGTVNEQQQRRLGEFDDLAPNSPTEDARKDPDAQQRNRERMGVDAEHKTDKMKRGRRGTFP